MKIYDTAAGNKKELDLTPFKSGELLKVYVCGPTVYNEIHIGNARPMVFFDAVKRYLEYKGCATKFVSNYTDVDDKIIDKANAEGVPASVITDKYIAAVEKHAKSLNCAEIEHPRVTENMNGIIDMVQTLIDKGFAYVIDGEVFFDVQKYENYGKISRKNTDDLEAGIRVEVDEKKRSPSDFVLWKPVKPGEPFWESPWGNGRPGWHIECSVMAKKYLGETLDIHGGGEDLIFPHHENEAAQSECANGAPLARFWLHTGMINVGGEKMSKSAGNFFLLKDAAKEFGYDVVRFFILSAHYRSPLNFSAELLKAAGNSLERIYNCAEKLRNVGSGTVKPAELAKFREQFEYAMDDDFNTANAVTAIFDLVKFANINATVESAGAILEELHNLCGILGIFFERNFSRVSSEEIEAKIAARTEAKKNKDFATADKIRTELDAMGVEIKDTREGTTWTLKK